MENLEFQSFLAAAIVGWGIAIAISFNWISRIVRRRTDELLTTKLALIAHYDAMEAVVDDPALPVSALEFLRHFSEVTADRELCGSFTSNILRVSDEDAQKSEPKWEKDIRSVAKSRPDIAENFHKAVTNGIIAMFLRWPGNSWKLQAIFQQIAADSRQEAVIADRIVRTHRGQNNHGPTLPNGLATA
jgi:hypothetical protein